MGLLMGVWERGFVEASCGDTEMGEGPDGEDVWGGCC